MAKERELGRQPVEQAFVDEGFDILSHAPDGSTYRIEVKAGAEGADHFRLTHNEMVLGKNAAPKYRLALVRVDPRGPRHDDVRYLENPFGSTDLSAFDATGMRGNWAKAWARGRQPF